MGNWVLLLNQALSAPLSFLCFLDLTIHFRYSRKTTRRLVQVYLLCILLGDALLYACWGATLTGEALVGIYNFISFLCITLLISHYRDERTLFSFFSACLFVSISDILASLWFSPLSIYHLLLKFIALNCIYFLVHRYFRDPYLRATEEVQRGWFRLLLVPVSLYICLFMCICLPSRRFTVPESLNPAVALSLCFVCLCGYLAIHDVFENLRHSYRLQENMDLMQSQTYFLQKHAGTLQSVSDQSRIFRHDMRHYLRMQLGCLENGDLQGATQILKEIDENLDTVWKSRQLNHYTGSGVIDAVLSFYEDKAELEQIDMHIRLELPRGFSRLTEFAVVLSNALENALNACLRAPAGTRRAIQLTGIQEPEQYFLEVGNTFGGPVQFGSDRLPQSGRPGHGYGTRSISAFAQRYDGILDYQAQDGWFVLRLLIPSQEENHSTLS